MLLSCHLFWQCLLARSGQGRKELPACSHGNDSFEGLSGLQSRDNLGSQDNLGSISEPCSWPLCCP